MLLMSDDLLSRVTVPQVSDLDTDVDAAHAEAVIVFKCIDDVITCPIKRFCISKDKIEVSFTSLPSLVLMLRDMADTTICRLTSGGRVLEFTLQNFTVTWDDTEGKQLCTIVSLMKL